MSGPLPDALRPVTRPLAWAYEQVIRARNRRFDQGHRAERMPRPVISVGNITTGGTGKTPMVMWIARQLIAHQSRPAIAMRGYGGTNRQPSDEQLEYAEAMPEIPLIIDPHRAAAIRGAIKHDPTIDVVVLDDGFQHRGVYRDLDLVLVDATRDLAAEAMLPAGHLREPLENLQRADTVIVTRAERVDPAVAQTIEQWHGRPPLAWTRHAWHGLEMYTSAGEPGNQVEADWLAGRRITTMLGLGNPRAVEAQLEAAGATIIASVPARDHERYTRARLSVARLAAEGGDALVMTRKDWVKAREVIDFSDWSVPIVIPRMEMEVFDGAAALQQLILTARDRAPSD